MSKKPTPTPDSPAHRTYGRTASRTTITYGELIERHCAKLEERFEAEGVVGKKAKQVKRNHLAAINGWLGQRGISQHDAVGGEFDGGFGVELGRHLVYLKVKPHRHKGKAVTGLSDSTIKNRASLLGQWHATWAGFACGNAAGARETVPEVLARLVKRSGLTPHAFAQSVGINHNTFNQWYRGTRPPSYHKGTVAAFKRIEREYGLGEGELVSRLRPTYGRKRVEDNELRRSTFGERQRRKIAERYLLKDLPSRLKSEVDGWFEFMTEPLEPEPPLRRNGFWFVDPETGECATADRYRQTLASYYGYLCLPVEGRKFPANRGEGNEAPDYTLVKGEGFGEERLTLALLGDVPLVRRYLEFLRERAGCYNGETVHFLALGCALLRRETGYVRQRPEIGALLEPPVPAGVWDSWCDAAHNRFRKIIGELTKNGLVSQSRDVEEPIEFILSDSHPIRYLYELADRMEDDLPAPTSKYQRAMAYRDMFLVRFLTANPLRVKHFSRMTWRADNTGNLYKGEDGSWWLRFPKEAFKNRRTLKKDKFTKSYKAPLPRSLWPYVETYLYEHRPLLFGADRCDYVFRPGPRGGALRHKTGDAGPMRPGSLSDVLRDSARYYLRCMGFGAHAYRHIIATDYLKNHPGGVMIAASILHDRPETILKYYGHLQHVDYFRHWVEYHEEQLTRSRAERGKEVAA